MKKQKTRSLRECKNINQVCELERDNFSWGDYWMISDGYRATICQQKIGESPRQEITIPRYILEQLLRRYEKQQTLVK